MKSPIIQLTSLLALVASRLSLTTVDAQSIPEVLQTDPELSMFSGALEATGLMNDILASPARGPFTVFGPTNDAFTALDPKYMEPEWSAHLTEILFQHVVEADPFLTQFWEVGILLPQLSGGDLIVSAVDPTFQINNVSNVVTPDLLADNGVVHAMDAVILPPSARDDIVSVVNLFPDVFSTLQGLLEQAGLTEALQGDGPFTLFAPSNAAFEALGPDVLANLQADEAALSNVLLYHVVPGIWLGETLEELSVTTLPTLQGSDLVVPYDSFQDGVGDVLAKNGILRK